MERSCPRKVLLSCWIVTGATAALACDGSFDTRWYAPADAGVPDGALSGGPDAAAGADAGPSDLGDATLPDVVVTPLKRINCALVMRDGSLGDACDVACEAMCLSACRDAGTCLDAELWLPCTDCAAPPTTQ